MKLLKSLLLLVAAAVVGGGAFLFAGAYNIGADAPHTRPMFWLIETLRDRSIAAHATGIHVPPLDDPALIAEGAEHYSSMCAGCHLAPGKDDSDIRQGLYPAPPKLSEPSDLEPAEMFWVIKHGVKTTAMPSWGVTHDDKTIWAIVAFLKKLPHLTVEQYTALTGGEEDHHHHEMAR